MADVQRPGSYLKRLDIDGDVEGQVAKLLVTIEAHVDRDGPVAIPMNPIFTITDFNGNIEPVKDGFLWNVEGKGDHELQVRLEVPLQKPQVGLWRLRMPVVSPLRVAISKMTLRIPDPDVVAHSGDKRALPVRTVQDHSVVEWNGLPHEGLLTLEWHRRAASADNQTQLQCEALWLVDVQKDVVVTEATLRLQARGGEFDKFQIQFPPGIELPSWTVPGRKSDNLRYPELPDQGALLSVMLQDATAGPLMVTVEFQQRTDPDSGEFSIGGLGVPGAISQSGFIRVRYSDNLEVVLRDDDSVQQIQVRDLPQGLKEGRGGLALRYRRQPFHVGVNVRPRKARLAVDPQFALFVGKQGRTLQAQLVGVWTVDVQRAAIEELFFSMAGWQSDASQVRVTPVQSDAADTQLVDREATTVDPSGRLRVRLSRSVQETLRVELRAQRALKMGSGISLPLPVAETGLSADAQVSIYSGIGVQVAPNFGAMPSAIPDFLPTRGLIEPANGRSDYAGEPLTLRLRDPTQPLSLDVDALASSTQAECRTRVTLAPDHALVEQTFAFHVQNEPLSQLVLDIPLSLSQTPIFVRDGENAGEETPFDRLLIGQTRGFSLETDPLTSQSLWRATVALPAERLGRFQWRLRFELPRGVLDSGQENLLIPLVMPVCNVLVANQLELIAGPDTRIDLQGAQSWRALQEFALGRAYELISSNRSFAIALSVSHQSGYRPEPVMISRACLRTNVDPDGLQRYDGLYLVQTQQESVTVRLPEGAQRPRIVSGEKSLAFDLTEPGLISVHLPADSRNGRQLGARSPRIYSLRVVYSMHSPRPWSLWSNSLALAAPSFPNSRWQSRWYWQVIIPKQQHLLAHSALYYTECQWRWQGLLWSRRPSRSTRNLNEWLRATPALEQPSDASNHYLFSRLDGAGEELRPNGGRTAQPSDSAAELQLWTATPPLLLLVASGSIVLFGLLLLQLRRGRNLVASLVVCAVLLVASMYPSPAILLTQASLPGLVLVGVAALLKANLLRRQRRGTLVAAERSNVLAIPSTVTVKQADLPGSVGSTRTGSRSSVGGHG